MFENPRRSRQARNFGKNIPKILDLKLSSEQIFSENCLWVPLPILKCAHFCHILFRFVVDFFTWQQLCHKLYLNYELKICSC